MSLVPRSVALEALVAEEREEQLRTEAAAQAAAEQQAREAAAAEAQANIGMLGVLVEMEAAWWSLSSADRRTVCGLFRDDRIGTSNRWVQLSGYGKPEYAFVFLSEACR